MTANKPRKRKTRTQRLELRLTPEAKEWFMADELYSPSDIVEKLAQGEWTIIRAKVNPKSYES